MPLGLPELAIILVILLVVFGAKKLPDLGKGLGSGMREFKDGISGDDAKKQPEQIAAPPLQSAPTQPAAPQAQPVSPETAPGTHADPDAPAPRSED